MQLLCIFSDWPLLRRPEPIFVTAQLEIKLCVFVARPLFIMLQQRPGKNTEHADIAAHGMSIGAVVCKWPSPYFIQTRVLSRSLPENYSWKM